MKVTAIHEGESGQWLVWAHLDEEHPLETVTSLVVGIGKTSDEAKASAVADLQACIEALQPASVMSSASEFAEGYPGTEISDTRN